MSATHAGTAGSEENEDAENEAAKLSDKADVEPQQKKTKQSSLYRRVTTALCLGAIWVTAALTGSYPLTLVLGLTQLIAVREYFGMVSLKGQAGATTICSACCLIFPLVAQYAPYRMSLMLPMAATTICVYLVLRSSLLKQTLFTFSTAIFGLFYLAYLPSFWVRLRGIDFASGLPFQALWPSVLGGPQHLTMGLAMFVGTVLCIIMADVGGYVVGKNFGRIQLTKVSPNKTVEGALGGAAGCVSMALLLAWSMHWPFWYLTGTAFGLIVFLASLFGDLTQSVMKRDAGVKDSGNILPGHGGILDRFDSYIFTAPLAYYFMQFLIIPLMGLGPWYK
jgi:phosphatidate cytidylyltransferase